MRLKRCKVMKSSDYRKKAIEHLVEYKENVLNLKNKNGMWRGKPYDHILPNDSESKNFIDPGYYDFSKLYKHKLIIKSNQAGSIEVGLHINYAHLNSSQVMCINYFTPLLFYQVLLKEIIRVFTGVKLSGNITGNFEYTPNEIDNRTSFDFYLEDETRQKLYFEIKYTEQRFGVKKCDANDWNKVWHKMIANSAYLNNISIEKFYKDYQINRNICRVRDTNRDHVCFIVPQKSSDIWRKQYDHRYKNVHWIPWESLLLITRYLCGENLESKEINECINNADDLLCIAGLKPMQNTMQEIDSLKCQEHYKEFYDKYFDFK